MRVKEKERVCLSLYKRQELFLIPGGGTSWIYLPFILRVWLHNCLVSHLIFCFVFLVPHFHSFFSVDIFSHCSENVNTFSKVFSTPCISSKWCKFLYYGCRICCRCFLQLTCETWPLLIHEVRYWKANRSSVSLAINWTCPFPWRTSQQHYLAFHFLVRNPTTSCKHRSRIVGAEGKIECREQGSCWFKIKTDQATLSVFISPALHYVCFC